MSNDQPDDIVARCQAVVSRAAAGDVGEPGVAGLLADLAILPQDHPDRDRLAATMVAVLTQGGRRAAPTNLAPHLGELLAMVKQVPPSLTEWPLIYATARAEYIAHAVASQWITDLDAAEKELDELVDTVSHVLPTKLLIEGARSAVQLARAFQQGNESVIRNAFGKLEPMIDLIGDHPSAEHLRAFMSNANEALAASRTGNFFAVMEKLAVLENLSAKLPPGSGLNHIVREGRNRLGVLSGSQNQGAANIDAEFQTGRAADASPMDQMTARLMSAAALFDHGEEIDLQRVDAAINECRAAVALGESHPEHAFAVLSLGLGLLRRSELTGTVNGLAEAERHVRRAIELLGGPGHQYWSFAHDVLSGIRHRVGDVDGVTDGQQGYALRALLESERDGARIVVREAADGAVSLARKMLAANKVAGALHALDSGRGLMLFAETVLADAAGRLTAIGQPELARRWKAGNPVSADLRREVVHALVSDQDTARSLLNPPSLAEIRRALTEVDADALVYLVPADDPQPGLAVIAGADGPPAFIALPNLAVEGDDEVERYLAALTDRAREVYREVVPPEDGFADRVDTLCDWAWRAAIGPLLERYFARGATSRDGRDPRIVLVPMGDLARIPWQAARRPDGTYAVQLAAFSYAVSARLFCENAAASPAPLSSTGLVVSDPDTAKKAIPLHAARLEAHAIQRTFYRGARYLGRRMDGSDSPSGRATVSDVRDWLTNPAPHAGTMLHLACHASFTRSDRGDTAALLLAPDEPGGSAPGEFGADEIIRLLETVPERGIGLVVMAACHTGRSIHGYDEAFSLGAAFLAGRVRTVLSTQWGIPDELTASLMFVFHHFLREKGMAPWAALREAQLWMLQPHPVPPRGMPPELVAATAGLDHASVVAWAGFVHSGQ